MLRTFSQLTGKSYRHIAKPILFKFSPDSVHNTIIKTGKLTGYIPPALWISRGVFSYTNTAFLGQTINGIDYKNPVGLSAGFDKNFELLKLLPSLGFGFIEGGSLTYHASTGNPRPHYRRLPHSKSILVNAGLNNDGAKVIVDRIKKAKKLALPLNISVAKTNSAAACTDTLAIQDYVASLMVIKKAKVGDIITINISCPNAFGGEPFTTPKKLDNLLTAIDGCKLTQPIYIKMPIDLDWQNYDKLLQIITKHNIAGVTTGNLAKNRTNPAIKQNIPIDWPGNLSGKPTKELSNMLIHNTYKKYGNQLTIIGVGGIDSAHDAYEKIKHGASLVELITGLIYEGPQVVGQINKGLVELARADGYSHISQAIGAYHRT